MNISTKGDWAQFPETHYGDVIMSALVSQNTGLTIAYSTVYSGADQRKHQSSTSLAFVWGIHWWLVNSPHKGPVTRTKFSFDDVIMWTYYCQAWETRVISLGAILAPAIVSQTTLVVWFNISRTEIKIPRQTATDDRCRVAQLKGIMLFGHGPCAQEEIR